MFARARLRLTLLFIVLFALVFGVFSVIFYVAITGVLAPAFDLAPELSNEQAAELAYQATVDRIGTALLVGNVLVIAAVGVVAWVLASRTLTPIREAHLRQRRFVADASHEMRSPLAAIRVTAEAAADGDGTSDELKNALRSVIVATDRLTRLTNDLLLLARTDERLIALGAERSDLSVIAAEAVEIFGLARSDGDVVAMELAPDLLVSAAPDDVHRILANLLDNAARYGGPGVRIRVKTSGSERDAIVEVIDSGPGIAATDIDRVFEPFFRVNQDAISPDGTGLGLALARSLTERSGGRLTVDSEPGVGSTFRLFLPRFR